MSSSEKQRGVFPGLEFFTTLGEIAKNATEEIKDINRELSQPSATLDLQDGNLWNELHLEYNKIYNQSIGLKQSLLNKQSISSSLESFNSIINWIKIETQRTEKQLQQFGYKNNKNNDDYQYKLPLTPQQQQIYDQQNNKNNHKMDIDHDEDDKNQNQNQNQNQNDIDHHENTNNNNNNNNNENHNNDDDDDYDDDDDDIDLKQNQESDTNSSDSTQKNMEINNKENKNKESSDNGNNNNNCFQTNIIGISQKIIPSTPKIPVLDDKFKFFLSLDYKYIDI